MQGISHSNKVELDKWCKLAGLLWDPHPEEIGWVMVYRPRKEIPDNEATSPVQQGPAHSAVWFLRGVVFQQRRVKP